MSAEQPTPDHPARNAAAIRAALAEAMLDASERQRLESVMQTHQREIAALQHISELGLREQPLATILAEVVEAVSACTGFPIVAIEFYDEARQTMTFAAATGIPLPPEADSLVIPVDQTLSGLVARSGQAIVETHAQERSEYAAETLRQLGVQTFVCVPMRVTDRVMTPASARSAIGTLALAHPDLVLADESLVTLAHSLANIVAILISRKRAEERSAASERQLRTILDKLVAGVVLMDADGRYLFVNERAATNFGLTPAEVVGKTLDDVLPPEVAETYRERNRHFIAARDFAEYEGTFDLAVGTRTFFIADQVLTDDRGAGYALLSSSIDITARKAVEVALRESQQNLETLIENTDGSIWSVDRQYRLIVGNRLFHQHTSVALGRPLSAGESVLLPAWPQAACDEWRGFYDRAMQQGPFSIEMATRFTDAPHTVEYRFSPISSTSGQAAGVTIFGRDITARKQAEAALQVALTKYQTLFDSFPLGITVADATGQIVESNAMAERLLGIGRAEHDQRQIDGAEWRIVRPDGTPMPAEEYASVRALREQRVVENIEMGVITLRGTTTWINVTAAPLPLAGYGVVITYSDITVRKAAEAALRASEAKFRTLAASIPQLIWTTRPDGELTYLSEQWAAYTGTPRAEILAGGWGRVVHPDDLPGMLEHWRQRVQAEAPLEIKQQLRHHSGLWRWNLVRGGPMRDGDGQITLWVGTCTDIHDSETRERHGQFLLDLELRTNYLEEPAPLEQLVIDQLGAFLDLTRCYFGHVTDDLVEVRHEWRRAGPTAIGTYRLHDYFTPEAIAQFRQNVPTVVEDVTSDPRTAAAAANHQALGIGAFITTPVVYQDAWVGALNIVSPQARVWRAEELNLLREVVARAWPQLERARAQLALHQALDELRRSNAELEQFAYVASHDLQEPLRAVTGMVQLLQQRYQGQLDARADEYIGLAVEAAARMQALINDLLAFSRLQRRAQPFAPTALETVLTAALANLRVAIEESGAVITHDELPTVRADASQLTQLFQNLLSNALKFRGEEPPRIHVGVTRREDAWCLAVRDNGIGIAPDYFERIFVIFQRLHPRRAYPGTGIGLALCKKIVEHHGGRIWVESHPGDGATFFFTIPDRS